MATLVLADDHQVVRQGLRALLHTIPDLTVLGEASDGLDALRLAVDLHPDVLLLDLTMPGLNGLEVIRRVRRRVPKTKVVVLSMHHDDHFIVEALRRGASAYVVKDAGADELVEAIWAVLQGRRFLSSALSPSQLAAYADREPSVLSDRYELLTDREREVLQLVAEGYTSVEIGRRLYISPRTAETHRSRLMSKLGMHSQVELVRYALQCGLIPLHEIRPHIPRPRADRGAKPQDAKSEEAFVKGIY